MKKTITLLLVTFLAIAGYSQSFEGKIVYQNLYKSKLAGVTDDQFTTMLGSKQEYFIKGGDYRSNSNGSFLQSQLYVNRENKLYSKMANSETFLWNDGAVNTDAVLKTELNKAAIEILGFKCDELILTCKSGVQKYYFNSKVAVDPKLFINHKFGNWYDYLLSSKSLPLKIVIDNAQFTMESIAIEVKEMALEKSVFELPAGSKAIKNPN
jgi:hypothetical protein